MNDTDTITAIATAPGNGAIGILRISGPEALSILQKVWVGKPVSEFEPRRVYVGFIKELDQALVFWMKAPDSYTGEDVVEIQAHGGQVLLETILENLLKAGARMAQPGEFTQRAFLNGRMDLAQAEAVADLIHATSTQAAQMATRELQGTLSAYVQKLRNSLKVMRAQMEAMIDFPEDGDIQELRIGYHDEIRERILIIATQIRNLTATYEEGRLFREGLRVAIIGKPNVGKSSLFNALLKEDRAIVHSTPGTTRDAIEEVLLLNGLRVRFIDTAGIRQGEEAVESEGIRRSFEKAKNADLVLVVIDSSRPLDSQDTMVFEAAQAMSNVFYLYNKTDLPPVFSIQSFDKLRMSTLGARMDMVSLSNHKIFSVSAQKETGLEAIKEAIVSRFIRKSSSTGSEVILTHKRHLIALEKSLDPLERIAVHCLEKQTLELLVEDLNLAMNHLGEITGEITNDEILGEIFSTFCIGK